MWRCDWLIAGLPKSTSSSGSKVTSVDFLSLCHPSNGVITAPGNFQHSSFLAGGLVTSAGLISVKDGLIHTLSPLSGHYRYVRVIA